MIVKGPESHERQVRLIMDPEEQGKLWESMLWTTRTKVHEGAEPARLWRTHDVVEPDYSEAPLRTYRCPRVLGG